MRVWVGQRAGGSQPALFPDSQICSENHHEEATRLCPDTLGKKAYGVMGPHGNRRGGKTQEIMKK